MCARVSAFGGAHMKPPPSESPPPPNIMRGDECAVAAAGTRGVGAVKAATSDSHVEIIAIPVICPTGVINYYEICSAEPTFW